MYFKAIVEVEKIKKGFGIASHGVFFYAEWRKWEKSDEISLSENFILRGILLAYVIRKYDAPGTIMLNDVAYDVDPEDCQINAAPLTVEFFNRDNFEVHKFLNSLTQGTKSWKWIEKSKGGRDSMKARRENYYGSVEGGRHMNITKLYLKELYFKRQDVSPFEKYVNRLN